MCGHVCALAFCVGKEKMRGQILLHFLGIARNQTQAKSVSDYLGLSERNAILAKRGMEISILLQICGFPSMNLLTWPTQSESVLKHTPTCT